jgi:hypothetical protein
MRTPSIDPFSLPTESTEPPAPPARRLRVPRPRVPRPRTRQEGGFCGNCGFKDTGHYCSRCGEPLHGTEESVMEILWSDLVEGPLHNLFALGKTCWLMLVHPHRFFHGVLRRQRGLAGFPFFLAPAWSRVSHKPHGVPNAVKYFVLTYTLALICAWVFGVNLVPEIPVDWFLGRGAKLHSAFSEPLLLLFVVFAAWSYAVTVSKLLGGRIDAGILTRFMLYLNGFALIPFMGMAVAGEYRWVLLVCLLLWLYVLFVLPQVALPRLFGVSRSRLAMAQGGALLANLGLVFVMVFCAGVLARIFGGLVTPEAAAAGPPDAADIGESGISFVERLALLAVDPVDSIFWPKDRWAAAGRPPSIAAWRGVASKDLFPADTLASSPRFRILLSPLPQSPPIRRPRLREDPPR